jgi:hypothetical protein
MITVFGFYLIIINVIGVLASVWYAAKGGVFHTRGVLMFSALWAIVNILGIIFIGTGVGV